MIDKVRSALQFALKYPALFLFALRLKRQKKTFLTFAKMQALVDGFMKLRANKPTLNVAEFGVGRGGSAQLLYKLVSSYGGHLTLYDVFGRIPPPSEKDGQVAANRYEKILTSESSDYYGNITNLRTLIEAELDQINAKMNYTIVEGRYEDTLPVREAAGQYDLVHIDCDWYESVKVVLEFLHHRMAKPAIIQFDDWNHWPGVKTAIAECDYLNEPSEIAGEAAIFRLS